VSAVPAILAFDTATSTCSIAVTRGNQAEGTVVGAISFASGVTHSRRLLGAIDWLLQTTELDIADLSALAVGTGPGSFTGLRIGMATAKGVAHGRGLPLIGISSLDAIGAGVHSTRLICVVMDARKGEVYCCFYRRLPGGPTVRCSEPAVMAPDVLAGLIEEPVTLAGDGARVYYDIFKQLLGESVDFLPSILAPEAKHTGFLASGPLANGDFLDIDSAAPDYVRSSDAQLSLVSPLSKR
jgi:tRNA threonylcarbamoyladenosine biosynthesis protein TsaB